MSMASVRSLETPRRFETSSRCSARVARPSRRASAARRLRAARTALLHLLAQSRHVGRGVPQLTAVLFGALVGRDAQPVDLVAQRVHGAPQLARFVVERAEG